MKSLAGSTGNHETCSTAEYHLTEWGERGGSRGGEG